METAATEGTKAAYAAWVSRRLQISRRLNYSRRLKYSRRLQVLRRLETSGKRSAGA